MRLLLGHDGSACSDAILHDLLRAGLPPDLDAEVLTVGDLPPAVAVGEAYMHAPGGGFPEYFRQERETVEVECRQIADQAAAKLRQLFLGWSVDTNAACGRPHEELIRRAEAWPADLLVVGSHGRAQWAGRCSAAWHRHACTTAIDQCASAESRATRTPLIARPAFCWPQTARRRLRRRSASSRRGTGRGAPPYRP